MARLTEDTLTYVDAPIEKPPRFCLGGFKALKFFIILDRPEVFEPATYGFVDRASAELPSDIFQHPPFH
jgi:hypothetical protein